ncbi:pyrroloquinoline-quinone synthase PqqC [Acidocella sp.]|jgi:coenzyme PQQ biosynthesis protein C|uniref:pyrroloquinoline-quinone synthase PqqC n=1 Tax=Acidocella sp. TaxID=50710 RepID=UPI002F41B099
MIEKLTKDEMERALRDIGARHYHNHHPFHRMLHAGACSQPQVQAWALNRYYYQSSIPKKDAILMARLPNADDRRIWRQRLVDHDGEQPGDGGIARWLRLATGVGLEAAYVESTEGILPATRFAVDAYVNFVRERSLLEAVASSLTELFSPDIIAERVAGMLAHYDFVSRETLAYFNARLHQAPRDADFALNYVIEHASTRAEQDLVLKALRFKCDVLWAQLDALYAAYVAPGHIPHGAFLEQAPAESVAR